jgi:transposase
MRLHANARTCPHSRRLAVDRVERDGWTLAAAAEAAGVSVRTVSKWLRRYRVEGEQGLVDRCSAPSRVPSRSDEARIAMIAGLRRLRMTGAEIAETLAMPVSTVSGILTRIGLGKLWRLEPLELPNRYEKERPGELVHIDVKKLGRISGGAGHRVTGDRRRQGSSDHSARATGWEYVHVAIDDATRLAYVEVLEDEKAVTAVGFLGRAVAHFSAHGIRIERPMTDNGSAYRATIHALACKALGIKHLRTQPY